MRKNPPNTLTAATLAVLLSMLMFVLPLDAQPVDQPPNNAAQAAQGDLGEDANNPKNLLNLLVMGGEMMIPILICSIIAVTVTIERFVNLQRGKVIPQGFVSGLSSSLGEGFKNIDAGVNYCLQSRTNIGNIFKAGIKKLSEGPEAVERAIEDAGAREVGKMKRKLRPLAAVATISPLLGLLGTVYGMIEAFQAASSHTGHGKSDMLAEGIYVALVTTAAGLTLAIPVLIIHQILSGKVDAMVDEIDESAIEFLESTPIKTPRANRPPAQTPNPFPLES